MRSACRDDIVTQDLRLALIRPQQAQQHADGGRLAGASWPQVADHLTSLDRERDVIHGGEIAEASTSTTRPSISGAIVTWVASIVPEAASAPVSADASRPFKNHHPAAARARTRMTGATFRGFGCTIPSVYF
jgi:hypothetical protein